ncbi:MAG: hypothetical protein AB1629_07670 [Candidatus Omnitrophota bacterium]
MERKKLVIAMLIIIGILTLGDVYVTRKVGRSAITVENKSGHDIAEVTVVIYPDIYKLGTIANGKKKTIVVHRSEGTVYLSFQGEKSRFDKGIGYITGSDCGNCKVGLNEEVTYNERLLLDFSCLKLLLFNKTQMSTDLKEADEHR